MLRLPSRQGTNPVPNRIARKPRAEARGWGLASGAGMVVGRTETPRSRLGFLTGSAKRARRYLCHEACIQRAECRISICVVTAQVENLCYGMRRGSGTG
jgi:hypothetical protein